MRQKISMVTLGVSDIVKSTAFYESLGWCPSGESKTGKITFFDMGGVIFGLYPREALADDAQVSSDGGGFRGVAVSFNASSKAEVDTVLADAVKCGGKLVKPAEDVFWGGYGGYFSDPDGHLFEVAYNPFWELDESGTVILPS